MSNIRHTNVGQPGLRQPGIRQPGIRESAIRQPDVRHTPVAPTRAQRLDAGQRIDAHRHDEHQIVHAGSGVVAVTTESGTWFAPGTRAIWIPAGTVHAHRAHGRLDLHLVGLPADANPLGLDSPAVLAVGPLLRELIVAYTLDPRDTGPERGRLWPCCATSCAPRRSSPYACPPPGTPGWPRSARWSTPTPRTPAPSPPSVPPPAPRNAPSAGSSAASSA